MSRMLEPPDDRLRIVSPTTTRKLAERMLDGLIRVRKSLPTGFFAAGAPDLLLVLYIAADDGQHLSISDVAALLAASPSQMHRWAKVIETEGYLASLEPLTLSDRGRRQVEALVETVYAGQRALD